jgi:ADP-heptose:LPS heptosyltransferase
MKQWDQYDCLRGWLEGQGHPVQVLEQRPTLGEYIADINRGDLLVCGDTLAMHIGLALRKKVVAIFICTSPHEIYDYGRMTRVVSPRLREYFYSRQYDRNGVGAVSFDSVRTAVAACVVR